jgi:Protein of unknown function (DUF3048) N-terminal domain/Protein of unknown function (DUF3048) C-terminal domain
MLKGFSMLTRVFALLFCATLLLGLAPAPATPATQTSAAFERGTLTKRPIAVMIDNHPKAYPQTGLDKATIVFEALAEFGITRYMAIYAPGISPDAAQIGPVRSARLYFVQWAMGFRAIYTHAGGSPQALVLLDQTTDVVNLDALKRNGGAYFTRSKKRSAPHNLFTSSEALNKAATAFKAADMNEPEVGYLFKDASPGSGGNAASSISYYFLYKQESVGWTYDAATNEYLRLRRGKAHVDSASGKQLRSPNVVIIEVTERQIKNDPKGRIEQDVVGSGVGKLFIDGVQIDITWQKENASSVLRFYVADGSEVTFNRGQIWISAVPNLGNVTVK